MRQHYPFGRHPVEAWRIKALGRAATPVLPETAKVSITKVIDKEEDDVWPGTGWPGPEWHHWQAKPQHQHDYQTCTAK